MANVVTTWYIGQSLGIAAPYYNLALVIVVLLLFWKLFRIPTKLYKLPWKFLCAGVLVFVVEEAFVIAGVITEETHFIFGFFEMIIILLFIYMLLLQREYIKHTT